MLARYPMVSYLAGASCARMGDDMSGPALLLLALAVSGSSAQAALMFGGLTVAAGAGGPLFGVALDRSTSPGRTLAVALAGYAVGLAAVAALLGRAPVIVAIAGAVLVGLLAPALAGGWTSQLDTVIGNDRLANGHALDAATYNLASLAGPALAAVLTAAWGAGWAVTIAVVVLFAAVPFARRLPARRHPVPTPDSAPAASVMAELREGFRAIVRVPGLRAVTAGSCTAYVGSGLFVVACPLLGRDHLGGAGHGALLLSVVAGTGLLATSAMARWPPRWRPERIFFAATTLAAVALIIIAVADNPAVLVLGVALLGIAEGPQLTAIFGIRQRDAPAQLRGQIFTTAASLKLTAGALGSVAGGILLEHSVTATLLVAAATQLLALLVSRRPSSAN